MLFCKISVLLILFSQNCLGHNIIKLTKSTTTADDDRILELPGLTFTPNFEHFSGYLDVSEKQSLFYWLVESQNNSAVDPLIVWFNGGPGCSSLFGLLAEHGPYLVNGDGKTLRKNPNAWNKIATVLYIEAPAGVGFSINSDKDYTHNDENTAEQNYEALKRFFDKFPKFRHQPLFITGESYGGVYVPTLATKILENQKDYLINLKGLAIGNGLLNMTLGVDTSFRIAYAHGFIDEHKWQKVKQEDCAGNIDDCYLDLFIMGYKFNLLDLLNKLNLYDVNADCEKSSTMLFPCYNDFGITTYLNSAEVKKSLHIKNAAAKWTMVNAKIYGDYPWLRGNGMEPILKRILEEKVPILLYHGDQDLMCNFLMGQRVAANLGFKVLKEKEKWMCNGQIGGFKTVYEKGLTFLTVRGAGHTVPMKKGAEIFQEIKAFINVEKP